MTALSRQKLKELEPVFFPNSIAIVGASWDKQKTGYQYVDGLLSAGFKGKIYPVNPKGGQLLGLEVYPSLTTIPGDIDYVIVSIPRQSVLPLLEECAAKRVKAVQFFTAGFSEAEDDIGQKLEAEIVKKAHQGGFRIIGPNCIGVYCPESKIPLGSWTTLGEDGSVSFLSQSGGMAISIVEMGIARGINYSKGISFGNGCDLDSVDFLEYFAVDPKTAIIGAYLEGVKDGSRFITTLKEVAKVKPLIVLKGGRTEAGADASISHTGALATSTTVWLTAVKQAGALPVNSLEELTDTMLLFQQFNYWDGDNIGIISGLPGGAGGGIAVSSTDTFIESGLKVPSLLQKTKQELNHLLGHVGSILRNPVDISQGRGNPQVIRKAIELVIADPRINLVMVYEDVDLLLHFFSWEHIMEMNNIFMDIRQQQRKPITVVLPPGSAIIEHKNIEQILCQGKVPVFPTLDRAAKAMVNLREYCRLHKPKKFRIGSKMEGTGKLLLIVGGLIALLGLVLIFSQHIPFLGRLPGDIVIKREGFSFYFPIVTLLLLSILLTIILNLVFRFWGK